jgi:hypothetical protein
MINKPRFSFARLLIGEKQWRNSTSAGCISTELALPQDYAQAYMWTNLAATGVVE